MPNLYFCDAGNHSRGMLRAVLSWMECECVLRDTSTTHLGQAVPSERADEKRAAATPLLYVLPAEATERWHPGYYRIHAAFEEIDNRLRNLAT